MSFQHLKRVKVLSEDLQKGMFVSELDINWTDSTFLLQGFTIEEQSDIDAVMSQCKFVYVDFKSDSQFKSYRLATSRSTTYIQENENTREAKEVRFAGQLSSASGRFRKSSRLMKGVMDRIMLGEDFDLHGVRDVVKENVKQVLENQDAMLMMTMLKKTLMNKFRKENKYDFETEVSVPQFIDLRSSSMTLKGRMTEN